MADWRDMNPRDYDATAPAQPLTLFPAPDPAGTPDLFDAEDLADNSAAPSDFTISHSHAEGTLARGGAKGDGSAAVFKANGFRWFRSLGCWGIQGSRDRTGQAHRIEACAAGLRAVGFTVDVEIDNTPRDYDTVRAERAGRLEARGEALAAKAERHQASADAHFGEADRIAGLRPFGQPILIGHHSERRARADQARIERNMDRGCEEAGVARDAARRAAAAGKVEAMRHRTPRAIAERIERTEAELRKIGRYLDGHTDRWHDVHDPATGGWREQLLAERARLTVQVEGDKALLRQVQGPGRRLLTRADIHKGDRVEYFRGWHEVVRVNTKTVSVTTGYSWTDTIPYTRIRNVDCPHATL